MTCLDAHAVARLFANRLSADERREVDVHVDACGACRQVIAGVARAGHDAEAADAVTEPAGPSFASGSAPATHHVVLRAGDRVDRYVIEGFLGAGAMGAVYEARDPQLDRRIALKIVPAGDDAGEGRSGRLVREAQAMARLSHPNIVPVHDAGRSGGIAYIAMQRVDGVSLRAHLATDRSSQAARLRLLVGAGRGLATAHAAGIVHRDLKPDNILVDRSGTALVGDFGLARLPGEPEASESGETVGEDAAWKTADGTILGTPAYMAPEVKRGARGDERADQYSFAVMLAEVLGPRPPRRIRKAIGRALDPDPARRHASIDALLAALEPPVTARRVAVGLGVVAAALAAFAVWPRGDAKDLAAACRRTGDARLDAEWSSAQRGVVAAHLAGLHAPGTASPVVTAALERVDRYAADWRALRDDVCEATDVRGEQTQTLRDLRIACLDDRLVEVAAVRSTLGSLTTSELSNAPGVPSLLGDLAQCSDARGLERRTPTDPIAVIEARQLRSQLAAANATILRGRLAELGGGVAQGYPEAEQAATRVIAAARTAHLPVIEADALRIRATLAGRGEGTGDPAGYYASLAIGDRLADPGLRADALVGLLGGATKDPARAGEVPLLTRLLGAALDELPGPQHDRRARLAGNLAVFAKHAGDLALAEQRAREAVQHFDASRAKGDPYLLNARQVLASILFAAGKLDDARRVRAEMLAAVHETYGEQSREMVLALVDEANQLGRVNALDEARHQLERALGIAESMDAGDAQIAVICRTLGFVLLDTDPAAARPQFARALAIFEAGGRPQLIAPPLLGLGEAELGAGDAAAAIPHLERGLDLLAPSRSLQHLGPPAQLALARALWQTGGDHARARALAAQALDGFRTMKGGWVVDDMVREVTTWLEAHR